MNLILSNHKKIHISEQCSEPDLINHITCRNISRDGQQQELTDSILKEHVIDVYTDNKLITKLTCIPQFLPELVLGHLLSEGYITDSSDVESIRICSEGKSAHVCLAHTSPRGSEIPDTPPIFRSSTNCLQGDPAAKTREILPVTPIPWHTDWIFRLADRFADGMPMHEKTWCTHSGFLARQDELLFQCEDIGRHNALDKVIGYALRSGIDLRRCIVYSSGRLPTDMVLKAIRAGVPILVSKASPTQEAILLAQKYGLTLISGARRDRMKLFAGQAPVPPPQI